MTPRETMVESRKIWQRLMKLDPALTRPASVDILRHLRAILPNKKGFGLQYPWNDHAFDKHLDGENK